MAIAFDASSGNSDATLTTPWTLTFSHTIGSGSDRLLVTGASYDGGSGTFTTTTTYNGVSCTEFAFADGEFMSVRGHYLGQGSMPAAGAHNIVQTWAADNAVLGVAASYSGVVDQAPEVTGTQIVNAGSTAWSVSLTTVTNNAVVIGLPGIAEDTNNTPDSPSTERFQENNASSTSALAIQDKILATAGSTTTSGVWTASKRNAAIGAAWEEAGGAPSGRIMSSLVNHGGLVGMGGLAGKGGGLAS